MTLSRVFATLTGREVEPARRRAVSQDSSPEVMAALLKSERVRFLPAASGDHILGGAHDVRERIAEILPGVTFDESGHGTFARTGYALAFDTGTEDHVRCVGVHITGGAAAVPPLARLIAKTGWRLESAAQDAA